MSHSDSPLVWEPQLWLRQVPGAGVWSFTGHISNVTEAVLRKGDEQGPEDVPESTSKEDEDSQAVFKSGNERLKPSVRKENDTVRDKEKVLKQRASLEELPEQQQAGSDADNEVMRLSSLYLNNSLIKANPILHK